MIISVLFCVLCALYTEIFIFFIDFHLGFECLWGLVCSHIICVELGKLLHKGEYIPPTGPAHQISLTQMAKSPITQKSNSLITKILMTNVLLECGQQFSCCTFVMQRMFHVLDILNLLVINHAISTGSHNDARKIYLLPLS